MRSAGCALRGNIGPSSLEIGSGPSFIQRAGAIIAPERTLWLTAVGACGRRGVLFDLWRLNDAPATAVGFAAFATVSPGQTHAPLDRPISTVFPTGYHFLGIRSSWAYKCYTDLVVILDDEIYIIRIFDHLLTALALHCFGLRINAIEYQN